MAYILLFRVRRHLTRPTFSNVRLMSHPIPTLKRLDLYKLLIG
jgi:hypothetical protein